MSKWYLCSRVDTFRILLLTIPFATLNAFIELKRKYIYKHSFCWIGQSWSKITCSLAAYIFVVQNDLNVELMIDDKKMACRIARFGWLLQIDQSPSNWKQKVPAKGWFLGFCKDLYNYMELLWYQTLLSFLHVILESSLQIVLYARFQWHRTKATSEWYVNGRFAMIQSQIEVWWFITNGVYLYHIYIYM